MLVPQIHSLGKLMETFPSRSVSSEKQPWKNVPWIIPVITRPALCLPELRRVSRYSVNKNSGLSENLALFLLTGYDYDLGKIT